MAFIEFLKEMFSYSFMVRAFTVGTIIALCASLLGVSLVLKRYSMIGNGLSSVGFGATGIAIALGLAPFTVALPVVILAAFLLLQVNENAKIKGDSAIALISTFAMALGVMAIYLKKGMNTDICNYLFGTILGIRQQEVNISYVLCGVVISLFVLFYNRIFAVTFDEDFAQATGSGTSIYKALISLCTALIVVVGMQMMGALLFTSLIVFPAITAMRVFKSFKKVIIASAVISVLCFWIGMLLSYHFNVPTGACIVFVNGIALALFQCIRLGGRREK